MGVDNNTRASCGLYTWLVSEGRRKGIPVIGLEISPLGNKNTLSQLPMDHYAVKSDWAKQFLLRHGVAGPKNVSVLRWEESYSRGQEQTISRKLFWKWSPRRELCSIFLRTGSSS